MSINRKRIFIKSYWKQQNSIRFRDPAQLNPPVQGFPLFGGGIIVPGIVVVPPLNYLMMALILLKLVWRFY